MSLYEVANTLRDLTEVVTSNIANWLTLNELGFRSEDLMFVAVFQVSELGLNAMWSIPQGLSGFKPMLATPRAPEQSPNQYYTSHLIYNQSKEIKSHSLAALASQI